MNNVCHDTFAGSRMCNTDDILHNGNVGLTTNAWMHPILIFLENINTTTILYKDSLNLSYTNSDMSCIGWTYSKETHLGRTSNGTSSCSVDLPVACCK